MKHSTDETVYRYLSPADARRVATELGKEPALYQALEKRRIKGKSFYQYDDFVGALFPPLSRFSDDAPCPTIHTLSAWSAHVADEFFAAGSPFTESHQGLPYNVHVARTRQLVSLHNCEIIDMYAELDHEACASLV